MTDLRLMIAIARAKQRFPAMRLCQIIVNATGNNDPFYTTDEALIHALDIYCSRANAHG